MKKLIGLILLSSLCSLSAYSHDLSLKYALNTKASDIAVINTTMEEVSQLLPQKLKKNLPPDIIIKIEALSSHKVIPDEVCVSASAHDSKVAGAAKPFIYGQYNQVKNTLTIHSAVVLELAKGSEKSTRINCQHKSLYDQAIATIIHEITHAYDLNNGRVSNSIEYINRAGFKKGLLKIKNKNIQAMRSADVYELVNIAESFAVNMEYFTMDPEFMCRKPSMFEYFKKQFEVDPFPERDCKVNNTVMMSSITGFSPVQLDASRVYRIDYLLASAGKDVSSGFGHSMFRIIVCAPERIDPMTKKIIPATPFGKKCLDDKLFHLVVSYRANVEDAKLNYLKGVTGGYPSMLFILSFSDVLDEYNRDELRDVISYPMKLTAKEREEFVTKVKEEHWNYRGSYKFINNNCAVESYDLLKAALDRNDLNLKKSLTPNGVLEDLDKLQYLSMASNEIETYKAKTDSIILAYNKAYGFKLFNSEKSNKSAVQKFIDKSTAEEREQRFINFTKLSTPSADLNAEVNLLKDKLVTASSFSVMEQQILRTTGLKFRKQAAEMFMDTENAEAQELIKETTNAFAQKFNTLAVVGYGIPFDNEMVTKSDLDNKSTASVEALAKSEAYLRQTMAREFAILEKIEANIQKYNKESFAVRKEFRAKLEMYINQVLVNLTREDFTRGVLVSAGRGDAESLKRVRELLGSDLVTDKEILDSKLVKLINDRL